VKSESEDRLGGSLLVSDCNVCFLSIPGFFREEMAAPSRIFHLIVCAFPPSPRSRCRPLVKTKPDSRIAPAKVVLVRGDSRPRAVCSRINPRSLARPTDRPTDRRQATDYLCV
jgi:hypothetical protein